MPAGQSPLNRPASRRLVAVAAVLLMSSTLAGSATAATPPGVKYVTFPRYAGVDRYATASAVAASNFPASIEAVYVATGAGFPDALAAGAAAVTRGSPVLLVTKTGIPASTAAQLARLNPNTIYLAGGTGVVAPGVATALAGYARSGNVVRLAGTDRYATAAAVSHNAFDPGVGTAYVATGANFPDALSGVPATGVDPGPILLTASSGIPNATATELTRLAPARIVILGGPGVVSASIATQLASYTSGSVTRIAGVDRFATSVAISKTSFATASLVYIATGSNYPDALAGGPAAGAQHVPLLLVGSTSVPTVVRQELVRLKPTQVRILGGTSVIAPTVTAQIEAALGFRRFGSGTHVVGSDVLAGIYRAPGGSGCYWERLSGFSGTLGDIIANDFGSTNPVVAIAGTDAGFNSSNCGTWYDNLAPITSSQTAAFGNGTFIVQHDIAAGTWQAPGGSSCYWERLSGFSGELADVIANGFGATNPVVAIAPGDAGFKSSACGSWHKL